MFGKGGNDQDDWRVDTEWLEGLQAVDLPPVDTLMQTCLLQPIQEQVQPPPLPPPPPPRPSSSPQTLYVSFQAEGKHKLTRSIFSIIYDGAVLFSLCELSAMIPLLVP